MDCLSILEEELVSCWLLSSSHGFWPCSRRSRWSSGLPQDEITTIVWPCFCCWSLLALLSPAKENCYDLAKLFQSFWTFTVGLFFDYVLLLLDLIEGRFDHGLWRIFAAFGVFVLPGLSFDAALSETRGKRSRFLRPDCVTEGPTWKTAVSPLSSSRGRFPLLPARVHQPSNASQIKLRFEWVRQALRFPACSTICPQNDGQ